MVMDRYPQEQGSNEWMTFNAVRDDHVDMFPVAGPLRYFLPHIRFRGDRLLFSYRLKGAH